MLTGFSSVEFGGLNLLYVCGWAGLCLLKYGAIYCMSVNMELNNFIIYLCFKCTYKLFKSVFGPVYSQMCASILF